MFKGHLPRAIEHARDGSRGPRQGVILFRAKYRWSHRQSRYPQDAEDDDNLHQGQPTSLRIEAPHLNEPALTP